MSDPNTGTAPEVKPADPNSVEHMTAMVQKSIDSGSFSLPEKWKSAEEFVKSHLELEKRTTQLSQELAAVKKTAPPKEETVSDLATALEDDTPTSNLAQDIYREVVSTGNISEDSAKKAIEAGIPKELLDAVVRDAETRKQRDAAEAAELVGGPSELNDLLAWGKENLSDADKATVQEQLRGPGWKLAVLGLNQLRQRSGGVKEPKALPTESGGTPGNGTPFETQAEMTQAIRDPRYQKRTDPEYVRMVEKRILATSKAAQKR